MSISNELITTIISALAIIIGTLIGAWFSWIISKKNTLKNIQEQYKILEENRAYDERCKLKKLCQDANIIRLDICTSIYQSIRTLKELEKGSLTIPYPIPINKDYACSVSILSYHYSLKGISYIYQLYGIIEKLNYDILNCDFSKKEEMVRLKLTYRDLLEKIYGNGYKKILKIDIDKIEYKELYDNPYIKMGFKEVLKKLDKLCTLEEINYKNCG